MAANTAAAVADNGSVVWLTDPETPTGLGVPGHPAAWTAAAFWAAAAAAQAFWAAAVMAAAAAALVGPVPGCPAAEPVPIQTHTHAHVQVVVGG